MAEDPYAGTGAVFSSPSEIRGPGYDTARRKDVADLDAKYAAMEAERRRLAMDRERLDRDLLKPLPEAPKPAIQVTRENMMKARGDVLGRKAAEVEMSLPSAEQTVSNAFTGAQKLLGHRGFEAAVGAPNPFRGGFGPLGTVPGSRARDFETALETYRSKLFPQAIAALRGTGPVSNVEGEKMLASLANLDTSTSEDEFKRQVQQSVDTLAQSLNIARKQASMGGSPFGYEDLMREKRRREALKGPR